MPFSRRQFLKTMGATAGAVSMSDFLRWPAALAQDAADARLETLAAVALDRARTRGASYADIRINRYRDRSVGLRSSPDRGAGARTGAVNHVPSVTESETYGFGVRVLHQGTWGFAAGPRVEEDEIARVTEEAVSIAMANAALRRRPVELAPTPSYRDRYTTPFEKDPFQVPVGDSLALLRAVNDAARVPGISRVESSLRFRSEDKYFASSEGSSIRQLILQIAPGMTATAVDLASRKSKSRSFQIMPVTGGYEHVERCGILTEAPRIGAEAVEHLAAPSVEPGVKDLVLLPSHLSLTIHESIGHSTELDRALGYEANFAGTSFLAPPEKVLGTFRFGSPLVNVIGDRTLPGGMATVGYDDDGVKATSFHIVKDGLFTAYQTIRDQAHLVGETASRGCCYADSFDSIPFQRMPNVWLEPGTDGKSLDDLIVMVEDGILIDGRGSYSIDQQRYNFQFGGDAFWEIKNGKKGRMLADVAYQSRTQYFWNACAAVADRRFWQNVGLENDGKGQPQQTNAMSHGCSPALFRGINVLRTE